MELTEVTGENWKQAVFLTTDPERKIPLDEKWIISNAFSLLQARYDPNWDCRLLVDGETPVGFAFYGYWQERDRYLLCRPDDPMAKGICPYHGNCLEGLASGPAIERRWGRKGAELSDCLAVWELEAFYIGQAICTYICTLSPERIVVGGGVMHQEQMLPMIRQEVRRQMHGYIQGKGMDKLEEYIVPVSLGDNQGVMGGVKLAMDAYIEEGGTL